MSKTYKKKPLPKEPDELLTEKLHRKRLIEELEEALEAELKELNEDVDTRL